MGIKFQEVIKKPQTPKIILGILITTIALGTLIYFATAKLNHLIQSPQEEASALTAKISAFYTLPQDETPIVQTLTAPENVRGQPFFYDAQPGDKLIIYKNSKTAILYRPKENKVIGSTTINDKAQTPSSPTVAGASTKKLTATILNGTNTPGLAKKYQDKITPKFANVQITTVGDAKTKGIKKSYLASPQKIKNTQEVSKNLGLEVQDMPSDEEITTDIVIVLGEDIISN